LLALAFSAAAKKSHPLMSEWSERHLIEFYGEQFFFLPLFWISLLHGNPPLL
jgi:hypothetical protein